MICVREELDRVCIAHCRVVAEPSSDNLVHVDYTSDFHDDGADRPVTRLVFTPTEAVQLIQALAAALASMNEARLCKQFEPVEHTAF